MSGKRPSLAESMRQAAIGAAPPAAAEPPPPVQRPHFRLSRPSNRPPRPPLKKRHGQRGFMLRRARGRRKSPLRSILPRTSN